MLRHLTVIMFICEFSKDHKALKVKRGNMVYTRVTAVFETNASKWFHIGRWFTKLTQRFTVRYWNRAENNNSNNTTFKHQKQLLKNKTIKVYLEVIKMDSMLLSTQEEWLQLTSLEFKTCLDAHYTQKRWLLNTQLHTLRKSPHNFLIVKQN